MRRFELHRDADATGFSGTGVVAEGVLFGADHERDSSEDQVGPALVALHWIEWPSTVVLHAEGINGVMAVHGHDGRTRLVWLDD